VPWRRSIGSSLPSRTEGRARSACKRLYVACPNPLRLPARRCTTLAVRARCAAMVRILSVAIVIAVGCFPAGCGGRTSGGPQPGDSGGASDSSGDSVSDSSSDSGTLADAWGVPADGGPWSPVCPKTLPAQGTSCTQDMLQCEYGIAWWNAACDTITQCSNGAWGNIQPSTGPCLPAPGPNAASCLVNPGAIQSGITACSQVGLTCWYGQGAECTCTVDGDAGSSPTWYCRPEPGCPSTRPPVGAGCALPVACTYAGCFVEQCQNGIWQNAFAGGCQ
jgi:hypothetical protein